MNTSIFGLSHDLLLRDEPQYFESHIVFDYQRNLFHQVDTGTLRILERIDRAPLCGPCIHRLARELRAGYSLERMLEKEWLNPLPNCGCDHRWDLRSEKPLNWVEALPSEQRPVAILSAPTQATLVITQRCDLACVHCNVSATSVRGPELIPLDTWIAVLDELERIKVFKVVLSGGEPFVYRDFDTLLEHFAAKRYVKSILTNGTSIRQDHVRLLKTARIAPTLSIDGADAETHDAFRRKSGAFASLLRTLGYLRDMDVPFNLVAVVHKGSADQVRAIAEIGYRNLAGALYFVPLKALGRGRSAQSWTVGVETYFQVRDEIQRISEEFAGMPISFDEELDEQEFGPTREKTQFQDTAYGYTTCMAGKNGLVVDDDGTVYGCMTAMQMKVHPVGSIIESSVEEIWRSERWGIFREPLGQGCRANLLYKGNLAKGNALLERLLDAGRRERGSS